MSNVESGGEFDQFCRTLATSTWQLAVLLVVVVVVVVVVIFPRRGKFS